MPTQRSAIRPSKIPRQATPALTIRAPALMGSPTPQALRMLPTRHHSPWAGRTSSSLSCWQDTMLPLRGSLNGSSAKTLRSTNATGFGIKRTRLTPQISISGARRRATKRSAATTAARCGRQRDSNQARFRKHEPERTAGTRTVNSPSSGLVGFGSAINSSITANTSSSPSSATTTRTCRKSTPRLSAPTLRWTRQLPQAQSSRGARSNSPPTLNTGTNPRSARQPNSTSPATSSALHRRSFKARRTNPQLPTTRPAITPTW